ncbi:hypothetical protein GOODEAATRI_022151 [Goodea atripinnis]|uniref:Fibronectin type-III domain-containing protein n=1 Tax=Goodea atripinnis TaxID=208336 RepID=A0ABV0PQQ7_9TELE
MDDTDQLGMFSGILEVGLVEVNGDVTTLQLTSLLSQTEYDVAVTPMYDEGPGAPMLGTAITGPNLIFFTSLRYSADNLDLLLGQLNMCIMIKDVNEQTVWCKSERYVVPAPKNLQFSEVTQTSFRATWDHGAPDVALYRISWTKKGENNFKNVS